MPGDKEKMSEQKNFDKEVDEKTLNEVDDPDFFIFKEIGDKISGVLCDVGHSKKYDFGLYTLQKKDKQVRFHGSAQLDTKMKQVSLGDYCVVTFMDVEERDKGEMKLFSVKR